MREQRTFTEEEKSIIISMRNEGIGMDRIAGRIGCGKGAIKRIIEGIEIEVKAGRKSNPKTPKNMEPKKQNLRPSSETIDRIKRLYILGYEMEKIAKKTGTDMDCVKEITGKITFEDIHEEYIFRGEDENKEFFDHLMNVMNESGKFDSLKSKIGSPIFNGGIHAKGGSVKFDIIIPNLKAIIINNIKGIDFDPMNEEAVEYYSLEGSDKLMDIMRFVGSPTVILLSEVAKQVMIAIRKDYVSNVDILRNKFDNEFENAILMKLNELTSSQPLNSSFIL